MDFFDKLGKKVSDTYNTASEKTTKLPRETKLKMLISENRDIQKQLFEKLGQDFYKSFLDKRDSEVAIQFIEQFKALDKTEETIKNYENEILSLKGFRNCIKCGEPFNMDFEFCPKCGYKQGEEE